MGTVSCPVIAYHLIMTFYGFWLPNDPRGSGSKEVWSEALKPFGPATFIKTPKSVARVSHDRILRKRAKQSLKYPPIVITGKQAQTIARGFKKYLIEHQITCYACAIMPEHVHLVISKCDLPIEKIAVGLKAFSVHELNQAGLHPFQDEIESGSKVPKLWARGMRKIYLSSDRDVLSRIEYVQLNPTFSGLSRQSWRFVTKYHGMNG